MTIRRHAGPTDGFQVLNQALSARGHNVPAIERVAPELPAPGYVTPTDLSDYIAGGGAT